LAVHEVTTLEQSEHPLEKTESPIVLENFSAFWALSGKEPVLDRISTTIPAGKLTSVIGVVGSSKTSLLLSFLGEIPKITGKIEFKGTIAYVE
jgi:ABC-type Mn2+/Zn2+ transport system ATPase subunit